MSNIPTIGVIVGRFQVHELHDGHLELIRTVRGLHNRVVIFVGVAPTLGTKRNPLDFETRRRMLQILFPDITVLSLPDTRNDDVWSKELDKRIREVAQYGAVTLYGGRDSFVPYYTGAFKPVELPLQKIKRSGEEVRAEISNKVQASSDFRAGVIYSTANQYPRVITTVDVAVFDANENLIMGRKSGEDKWRFIGGHAEPTSISFEDDARREVREETGLKLDTLEYVGSALIDDWRYRKGEDKIKTVFFHGRELHGQEPVAGDDIVEVKKGRLSSFGGNVVPEHMELFEMLVRFKQQKERDFVANYR